MDGARGVDAESELGRAIDQGELALHYQPVIDLTDGRPTGVEALVRWQHPTGGLLAPDDFLHAVEQSVVITELTRWVIRAACAAAVQWPAWTIAVNVSARDLVGASLAECVDEALTETHVAADRLVLEVTETALVQDIKQAADTLESIRGRGVAVALDDFGTGYSSMLYLRELPVSGVKIDRELIEGLDDVGDDRAIVASLLTLAQRIGLTATAEGVETRLQARVLRGLGCPFAQGYWWSRPQPPEATDQIYREGLPAPISRPKPKQAEMGEPDPHLADLVRP